MDTHAPVPAPELWRDFDSLPRVDEEPASAIATLVDELLQSLGQILSPGSGPHRGVNAAVDAGAAQRLQQLTLRIEGLPDPARAAMQPVVQAMSEQLQEIRRLGAALESAARDSEDARRAAEQYAMTDPLTGLLNRRGFAEQAAVACRAARASGASVLLMFVDIDLMKEINDRGGHEAGDRAIQAAAETLRRSFRAEDLIVRWGGDEFAVLSVGYPLTPADAALRVRGQAERVCAEFSVTPPISLSLGAAGEAAAAELNLEDLLVRADRAMYHSKQAASGRRQASDPRRRRSE